MIIKKIIAHEILDSRGNPTIECHLTLDDDFVVTASVPSGASVGSQEALELRDHDVKRYGGMGVLKAIHNIHNIIAPQVINQEPDFQRIDTLMLALDGTPNKVVLGANALLAVSMAVARAQAYSNHQELFQLFADVVGVQPKLPKCMFNVLNGGAHAQDGLSFQEFMIMPHVDSVIESVRIASEIYHALKEVLHDAGYQTTIGDEGGFAPVIAGNGFAREVTALNLLMQAVEKAGYKPGNDVSFCLDVAASQFYDKTQKNYYVDQGSFDAKRMILLYQELCTQFPIVIIEDGLSEYDLQGWQALTQHMGTNIGLVGDDIFVTNPKNIEQGIKEHIANAVLIKLNQIGTVSEALEALLLSQQHNYSTVISHRSGETDDSFIADFVVGTAAGYIKAGAPARGERLAKYNRLMDIERCL